MKEYYKDAFHIARLWRLYSSLLGSETTLLKLPIFSEFMENSTKFMKTQVWPNRPKICARRTKTGFKDRGLTA